MENFKCARRRLDETPSFIARIDSRHESIQKHQDQLVNFEDGTTLALHAKIEASIDIHRGACRARLGKLSSTLRFVLSRPPKELFISRKGETGDIHESLIDHLWLIPSSLYTIRRSNVVVAVQSIKSSSPFCATHRYRSCE